MDFQVHSWQVYRHGPRGTTGTAQTKMQTGSQERKMNQTRKQQTPKNASYTRRFIKNVTQSFFSYYELPATSHEPRATSCELPATSHELKPIHYPLSTIHKISATSCELRAIHYPPSTICCCSSPCSSSRRFCRLTRTPFHRSTSPWTTSFIEIWNSGRRRDLFPARCPASGPMPAARSRDNLLKRSTNAPQ